MEDLHGYDITSERVAFVWGGDDGDGTGRLTVSARAIGFAGVSAAWFDRGTVLRFAEALRGYPLPDAPIEIASGFGKSGDNAAQEHVGIRVGTVGSRGQVAIWAHLATERWPDTRQESAHKVRLELLTTYERLRHLSADIAAVVDGTIDHAEIGGEILD